MQRLIMLASALSLTACTTATTDKVTTITERVCMSAPLAIAAYQAFVTQKNNQAVTNLVNFLSVSCPAVLTALQQYRATQPAIVPTAPPPPAPGPERG